MVIRVHFAHFAAQRTVYHVGASRKAFVQIDFGCLVFNYEGVPLRIEAGTQMHRPPF